MHKQLPISLIFCELSHGVFKKFLYLMWFSIYVFKEQIPYWTQLSFPTAWFRRTSQRVKVCKIHLLQYRIRNQRTQFHRHCICAYHFHFEYIAKPRTLHMLQSGTAAMLLYRISSRGQHQVPFQRISPFPENPSHSCLHTP